MIILAGETEWQETAKEFLTLLGYQENELLPNLHAKGMFPTAPAASPGALLDWLTNRPNLVIKDFKAEMDRSPVSGAEWAALIKGQNETLGESWFIHDFRPLWFLDDFVKAAGGVKIIALIAEDTPYQEAIKRFLEKRLPDNWPVLKLTKPPTRAQLKKFLDKGEPVSIDDMPTLNEIAGSGK